MFSLFVGLIVIIIIISAAWIIAGKLGIFGFIGNSVLKLKNIFKEEEK